MCPQFIYVLYCLYFYRFRLPCFYFHFLYFFFYFYILPSSSVVLFARTHPHLSLSYVLNCANIQTPVEQMETASVNYFYVRLNFKENY